MSNSEVRLDLFDKRKNLERGKPFLVEMLWYITKVVFFLSALPYPNKLKCFLLRLFNAKVGKGVIIKPRVNIHLPWKLDIGNYVWIGEEVSILNFEQVSIGNNVCISQRAFLCGGNHNYREVDMPYKNGPITLKDGCWIGANAFIPPNITIGVDTIISACSFVNKSVGDNSIYAGNPIEFKGNRWK